MGIQSVYGNDCVVGSYWNNGQCEECPGGKTSFDGADNIGSCYCAEGSFEHQSGTCVLCGVGTYETLKSTYDCADVPFGRGYNDTCGVCHPDGYIPLDSELSCSGCDGVPFSGKVYDFCGICDGGNSTLDHCIVCDGDNSTCMGCDGIPNSGLVFDFCDVCDGGNSTLDHCMVCSGDNSTCTGCDGVLYSGLVIDSCAVCGGDNSTCSGCDGVPNSGLEFDSCGVCDGDNCTCPCELGFGRDSTTTTCQCAACEPPYIMGKLGVVKTWDQHWESNGVQTYGQYYEWVGLDDEGAGSARSADANPKNNCPFKCINSIQEVNSSHLDFFGLYWTDASYHHKVNLHEALLLDEGGIPVPSNQTWLCVACDFQCDTGEYLTRFPFQLAQSDQRIGQQPLGCGCSPCVTSHLPQDHFVFSGPGVFENSTSCAEECATDFYEISSVCYRIGECYMVSGECFKVCAAGFSDENDVDCMPCASGKFKDTIGTEYCQQCPIDTYQNKTGQTVCLECLARSTTEGLSGQDSINDCICRDENPRVGPVDIPFCSNCKPGEFAAVGLGCRNCSSSSYTTENHSTQCIPCLENSMADDSRTGCLCNAGYTCPRTRCVGEDITPRCPGNAEPWNVQCPQVSTGQDRNGAHYEFQAIDGNTGTMYQSDHFHYLNGETSWYGIDLGASVLLSKLHYSVYRTHWTDADSQKTHHLTWRVRLGNSSNFSSPENHDIDARFPEGTDVDVWMMLERTRYVFIWRPGKDYSYVGPKIYEYMNIGEVNIYAACPQSCTDGNCTACASGKFKETAGLSLCQQCPVQMDSPEGSDSREDCQCNAGYTGPDGGPCSACVAGKYKSVAGDASCLECPENSISAIGGQVIDDCICNMGYTGSAEGVCKSCIAGKYKNEIGNANCTDCADGTYSTMASATSSSACSGCPTLTTSSAGSDNVFDCKCKAGYTGPDGGGACEACESGKHKAHPGSWSCNDCMRGKYLPHEATALCLDCPSHTSSPLGSDVITDCTCNAGYKGPDGGACVACVAGKYSPQNGSSSCIDCEGGTFSTTVAATSSTTCTSCAERGVHRNSPAGSDSGNDCECNIGYHLRENFCQVCLQGKYKYWLGNGWCTECETDTYSTAVGATSIDVCTPCPPNTSSPAGSSAASACQCIAGFTGPYGGPCVPCVAGKYKDSTYSGGTCTDCASGTFSTTVGATSSDVCLSCSPDTSSSAGSDDVSDCKCVAGLTGPDGGPCVACVVGKYKDVIATENCTDCLSGTYSTVVGATSNSVCEDCPSDTSSLPGSYSISDCHCAPGFEMTRWSDTGATSKCYVYAAWPSEVPKLEPRWGQHPDCPNPPCGVPDCDDSYPGAGDTTYNVYVAVTNPLLFNSYENYEMLCSNGYSRQYILWWYPEGHDIAASGWINTPEITFTACMEACNDFSDTLVPDGCTAIATGSQPTPGKCVACAAGKYKAHVGAELDACVVCPEDTYQPATGSTSCIACPSNSNSPRGTNKNTSCICNSGYSGPNGGPCIACQPSTYKPTNGSDACTTCPTGKFSSGVAATSSAACSYCLPGQYSTDASATSNLGCRDCPSGTFQHPLGTQCVTCPPSTTSPERSANFANCTCKSGYIDLRPDPPSGASIDIGQKCGRFFNRRCVPTTAGSGILPTSGSKTYWDHELERWQPSTGSVLQVEEPWKAWYAFDGQTTTSSYDADFTGNWIRIDLEREVFVTELYLYNGGWVTNPENTRGQPWPDIEKTNCRHEYGPCPAKLEGVQVGISKEAIPSEEYPRNSEIQRPFWDRIKSRRWYGERYGFSNVASLDFTFQASWTNESIHRIQAHTFYTISPNDGFWTNDFREATIPVNRVGRYIYISKITNGSYGIDSEMYYTSSMIDDLRIGEINVYGIEGPTCKVSNPPDFCPENSHLPVGLSENNANFPNCMCDLRYNDSRPNAISAPYITDYKTEVTPNDLLWTCGPNLDSQCSVFIPEIDERYIGEIHWSRGPFLMADGRWDSYLYSHMLSFSRYREYLRIDFERDVHINTIYLQARNDYSCELYCHRRLDGLEFRMGTDREGVLDEYDHLYAEAAPFNKFPWVYGDPGGGNTGWGFGNEPDDNFKGRWYQAAIDLIRSKTTLVNIVNNSNFLWAYIPVDTVGRYLYVILNNETDRDLMDSGSRDHTWSRGRLEIAELRAYGSHGPICNPSNNHSAI